MEIENYTLVELRQLAKEKGIKNVSKLKKEELVELLSGNENNEVLNENNVDVEESSNIINEIKIPIFLDIFLSS